MLRGDFSGVPLSGAIVRSASSKGPRGAYVGMGPENSGETAGHAGSAHAELRAKLRARYAVSGEYVGAATLARILGLGRTTVHDQVKTNRFVIPHRFANRKPLFLLDDVVAWMLGREWPRAESIDVSPSHAGPNQGQASATFKHADVEEAFLKVCEKRGIAPASTGHRSSGSPRAHGVPRTHAALNEPSAARSGSGALRSGTGS